MRFAVSSYISWDGAGATSKLTACSTYQLYGLQAPAKHLFSTLYPQCNDRTTPKEDCKALLN